MGVNREARKKAMGEILRLASRAMKARAEAKRAPKKPAEPERVAAKGDELSDDDADALISAYDIAGATPEA